METHPGRSASAIGEHNMGGIRAKRIEQHDGERYFWPAGDDEGTDASMAPVLKKVRFQIRSTPGLLMPKQLLHFPSSSVQQNGEAFGSWWPTDDLYKLLHCWPGQMRVFV